MDRRQFIRHTAITASSLVLPGICSSIASRAFAASSDPLRALGRFSKSIGYDAQPEPLDDYVRQHFASRRSTVEQINRQMVNDGFTDFSQTVAYHGKGNLFYAALHSDGYNACAPFFGGTRVADKTPMLEGASVFWPT